MAGPQQAQASTSAPQPQAANNAGSGRKNRKKRAKQRKNAEKQRQQAQTSARRASAYQRGRGGRSSYAASRSYNYRDYEDMERYDVDTGLCGFSEGDAWELACQGVKPWDDDAYDVLAALSGDY
ncbi:hypothetical protein C8F01DRAFT_1119125 [Mycena amicta]|nr:hypothetical protein C8F01DRAFT_1119125 [Mycena amicta]